MESLDACMSIIFLQVTPSSWMTLKIVDSSSSKQSLQSCLFRCKCINGLVGNLILVYNRSVFCEFDIDAGAAIIHAISTREGNVTTYTALKISYCVTSMK